MLIRYGYSLIKFREPLHQDFSAVIKLPILHCHTTGQTGATRAQLAQLGASVHVQASQDGNAHAESTDNDPHKR